MLSQQDKRTYNSDIYHYCFFTFQYTRKHWNTLFCKSVRHISSTSSSWGHNLWPQTMILFNCNFKQTNLGATESFQHPTIFKRDEQKENLASISFLLLKNHLMQTALKGLWSRFKRVYKLLEQDPNALLFSSLRNYWNIKKQGH